MLDEKQLLRYSRQLILKEIGANGQKKIGEAKILVVGAGGLGSPALSYLAAAGVGTLGVVDFDKVGISNLQRQILFTTDDINKSKVEIAKKRLNQMNPEVKIIEHDIRLDIDNIEDVIKDYDVVIDATDNYVTRYLVSDCCYFLKKPVIEGAVLGFVGILMTIIPDKSPCYRCLYPMPPKSGTAPTCSDIGIMGMVAGTIGSLQALEAIKIILGIGETLSGKVLFFDGLDFSMREMKLDRDDKCPLCGKDAEIKELIQYKMNYCANKVKGITPN